MNKTYFKPQFKVVKLHGRIQLLGASKAMVIHSTTTNLEDKDKIDFGGSSDDENDYAR